MRVSLFIIGLYLIVSGLRGNSHEVWTSVTEQKAFVTWIFAAGILWAAWKYAPGDSRPVVHGLIGVGLIGLVIVNYQTVLTDTKTLWTDLQTL